MIRGQAGVGTDSAPGRPTPGRSPVAACEGLRPIAARVPTGGAAAAEADRPAQPAGAAPASPAPRSHCPFQSRGAGPRGPGRGERLRKGRCVSVLRCGVGQSGDLPLHDAQRGTPVVTCTLSQDVGSLPDQGAGTCPRLPRSYLCRALPLGVSEFLPPQACAPRGQPGRPCRVASGTARPQIPGCPGSRPGPSPRRLLPQLR